MVIGPRPSQTGRVVVKARNAAPLVIASLNPLKKVLLIVPRFLLSNFVQTQDIAAGVSWSSRFHDSALPLPPHALPLAHIPKPPKPSWPDRVCIPASQ
jgi:hypothetical protein